MSGATSVPVVPTAQARPAAAATAATGGGGRTDSFGKRIVIHSVLILASLIAAFPVFRVLRVSLRPEDSLLEREF